MRHAAVPIANGDSGVEDTDESGGAATAADDDIIVNTALSDHPCLRLDDRYNISGYFCSSGIWLYSSEFRLRRSLTL